MYLVSRRRRNGGRGHAALVVQLVSLTSAKSDGIEYINRSCRRWHISHRKMNWSRGTHKLNPMGCIPCHIR